MKCIAPPLAFLLMWLAPACFAAETAGDAPETCFSIGGTGGAYFLAEPGELTIDVYKRDRNLRHRTTELRAILVGPDRQVIQEKVIPDSGQPRGSGPGPFGHARLSTKVKHKGIYGLNVTVSQDRYGQEILWGLRTNCPRWLVETARGHKDERHQEPIVLAGSDRPADVCFLPRGGPLCIDVEKLPAVVEPLTVYDGHGKLLATLPVADGRASHTFSSEVPRDAVPWRLHVPVGQATVHVDGLTRWATDDPFANLSLWTPRAESFFAFQPNRWLLTPYCRTVYGQAGSPGQFSFEVYNNASQSRTIALHLEFPGARWAAELSEDRLVLGPKKGRPVAVRFAFPAEGVSQICHLRVTPADDPSLSTYSTLKVRAGAAPAAAPPQVPLVLKPYCHENEQFGYLPDYPTDGQMYFDLANRPFVRAKNGFRALRPGGWTATDFRAAVVLPDGSANGRAWGSLSSKVAFDRQGGVYLLGSSGGRAALLHSTDGGSTFTACEIPRRAESSSYDFEQFSGHNTPDAPPPILRYTRTASDPKLFWRRLHDLELFLPEYKDGRLTMGPPILITKKCIGLAVHSGIPSTVVSGNGKVHIVWGEVTEPDEKSPGVPTWVATCDRATRTLGKPTLVGYGPPANDIHNTPSITMDSRGYLHVLAGTHGRPFPYARSLEPNDASAGWTEAEPTGEGLRQTYIGLVCGPDDTLHAVFRLWRSAEEPFPASHHAVLAYQRKRPGKPWEPPRALIVPPFSEYSVFYHRLTIDRAGRLFLSYDYWSTYWFYRNDHRGSRRAVLMSPDGGETWKMATDEDLAAAQE